MRFPFLGTAGKIFTIIPSMASNSTDGWENLPLYLLYSVQGLVISGGNMLISLSIIRYEALRTSKEYLVMLSLSLADTCTLGGFLVAGK